MFGGVGYLRGNMCFAYGKTASYSAWEKRNPAEALKKKHVKVFDITGRAMKGWVMVDAPGIKSDP